MKIIQETVDREKYIEIALAPLDMDMIDDGRMLQTKITIGKNEYSLAVRSQTPEELYAVKEG